MFSACKKYEDKSLAYIATCKTSENALKIILKSLYQAKEKLDKVIYKNEKIKNSTASTRIAREAKSYTTTAELITSITTFTTKSESLDVDQIGTDDTIKSLAKNIAITSIQTMTFTTAQITTVTSITVTPAVVMATLTLTCYMS